MHACWSVEQLRCIACLSDTSLNSGSEVVAEKNYLRLYGMGEGVDGLGLGGSAGEELAIGLGGGAMGGGDEERGMVGQEDEGLGFNTAGDGEGQRINIGGGARGSAIGVENVGFGGGTRICVEGGDRRRGGGAIVMGLGGGGERTCRGEL